MTALTKNDLINAVAAHGLSKRQSASVVETLFDIIFNCFEQGEDVKIVGFGHFRIRRKASRRGRNPQTGDSIEITARKGAHVQAEQGAQAAAQPLASRGRVTQTIPDKLYYRIGEVESITEVPAYVLRYWESEFKLLRPKKNPAGQRLYRKPDLELVLRHQVPALRPSASPWRAPGSGSSPRRAAPHQMDLGLKGMTMEETLRRTRERLRALRDRLEPRAKVSARLEFSVANPYNAAWVGAWRSPVAHLTGGQGVAGSNPVAPTIFMRNPGQILGSALLCLSGPRWQA